MIYNVIKTLSLHRGTVQFSKLYGKVTNNVLPVSHALQRTEVLRRMVQNFAGEIVFWSIVDTSSCCDGFTRKGSDFCCTVLGKPDTVSQASRCRD